MELNLKTREELLKNLHDEDKAKIDQMLNTTIWKIEKVINKLRHKYGIKSKDNRRTSQKST